MSKKTNKKATSNKPVANIKDKVVETIKDDVEDTSITSKEVDKEEVINNNIQNEPTSNEVVEVIKVAEKSDTTLNEVVKVTKVAEKNDVSIKIEEVDYVTFDCKKVKVQCITLNINETMHKYIIPYGFIISDDGFVYHWEEDKDGNTNLTLLSNCLVIPTGIIENIDTKDEKLELSILKNNQWEQKIFAKTTLYGRPIELSNLGLKITPSNSKLFSKYIVDFEVENGKNLPISYSVSNLGWVDNKNFVPFNDDIKLDLDYRNNFINGYKEKGTLEEWVNSFAQYRTNNIFRFMLAGAFSAPLLKLLNERPVVLYNYGPSRSGKTALLNVALSTFGEPQKLITSYNSTQVGLERLLAFNNDLPVAIDERQIADNQRSIEKMVFMIANQEGRVRGSKYGGLAQTANFTNIVLSTGEEPLAQTQTTTGVSSRCIEVYGSAFKDEKEASQMYKLTSKYYGTAGKFFIQKLIDTYSENNYQELKERLEELKNILEEKSTSNVGSYISSIAVITLADELVSKWIFNEENAELSINMAITILNSLVKAEDMDVVTKAYDDIISYITANHSRFAKYTSMVKEDEPEEDVKEWCVGLGLFENGVYYIFSHALKKYMLSEGYQYLKLVNEFAERGLITPAFNENGTIKSASIQKKYRNHNVRMYAFPVEQIIKPVENSNSVYPLPKGIKVSHLNGGSLNMKTDDSLKGGVEDNR